MAYRVNVQLFRGIHVGPLVKACGGLTLPSGHNPASQIYRSPVLSVRNTWHDSTSDYSTVKHVKHAKAQSANERSKIEVKHFFDETSRPQLSSASTHVEALSGVNDKNVATGGTGRVAREEVRKHIINDIYEKLVSDGNCRYLSLDEWEKLDKRITDDSPRMKTVWSKRLLDLVFFKPQTEGLVECVDSLVEFIHHKNQRISPLFLRVGRMHLLLNQQPEDSEEVLNIYDRLTKEYDVFDPSSLSRMILALCRTHRWKHSIELLDMYKITACVGTGQYSPIIAAAFRNHDDETAYELIRTMYESNEQPLDVAYLALLSRNDITATESLLTLLGQHEWIVSENVVNRIRDVFERQQDSSWESKPVLVKKRSKCDHCNEYLRPMQTISESEFLELRARFMEKSLMKDDVFQNTSPQELLAFQAMLETQGPFDVIIDGLNTAYGTHQKASPAQRINVLLAVVEHFAVSKQQRVLVLSKRHMQSWPKKPLEKIKKIAHCFFTSDSSEDDTFILYAALSGGPNTIFVTRDEFRDHRFLLGHEFAQKFKHWQLSQQAPFLGQYPEERTGKKYLSFKWPNKYHTCVQPSARGWHIPYDNGEERASYQVPNTWLCLRKREHCK